MKKFFFIFFVLLIISAITVLMFPEFSQAQAPLPPLPEEPAQNPIDGGLGILAAAGGAYAFKKLRDKKK